MSRSADIDFTFTGPVRVSQVARALSASGWSPVEPLGISYAVEDEDGDLDWFQANADSVEQVIATLTAREERGEKIAVSIYNAAAQTGGILLFFTDKTEVSFTPRIDRRTLPMAHEFTDIPWYVNNMLPPLFEIGLLGYQARDVAD